MNSHIGMYSYSNCAFYFLTGYPKRIFLEHSEISSSSMQSLHHVLCLVRRPKYIRDHFVNAPSQWETTLHCNVVSHRLGAFTEGYLHTRSTIEWILKYMGKIDRDLTKTKYNKWWNVFEIRGKHYILIVLFALDISTVPNWPFTHILQA